MARTFDGYRLSPAAEADLEAIYVYSIRMWSGRQANLYIDQIEAALEELAAGLRIGRARPDLGAGYLSLIVGSHLVVYREIEAIFVVRILHGAMDVPEHPDLGAAHRPPPIRLRATTHLCTSVGPS